MTIQDMFYSLKKYGFVQDGAEVPENSVSPDGTKIKKNGEWVSISKNNESKFTIKTNETKPNGQLKKGALKVLNKEDFKDFIKESKNFKENVKISLGELKDDAKKRIEAIVGKNIKRIVVESGNIKHAFKKKNHNLLDSDLDDMAEIINTTTDISLSPEKSSEGLPVVIFRKQEPNGVYILEKYRAGREELAFETAYRIKKQQPLNAPK